MSIGALSTIDDTEDYEDVVRSTYYAYGDKDITVVGGATRELNLVDLIAPAHIHYYFTSGTDGYSATKYFGTSYAAPIVSGIAGLAREWMEDINWDTFAANAWCLFTGLIESGPFCFTLRA